jgi:hypothetical protein
VSSQPSLFLNPAFKVSKAGKAAVSEQTEVPYPTKSAIFEVVGHPESVMVSDTKATLPFEALIAIVGFET